MSFDSYPADNVRDAESYKAAIDGLKPGDAITIFTPDTTHYPIALYAIERKIHVLITKPAVKTVEHHQALLEAARKHGVYVYIEHHKRYDPAYADARYKAQKLGDFNYFYSYGMYWKISGLNSNYPVFEMSFCFVRFLLQLLTSSQYVKPLLYLGLFYPLRSFENEYSKLTTQF